ncbi:MAG: hypothetical protein ACI9XZ_003792 [Alphaproteobacteria bacterium]|jgi:hypothetical protein
MLLEATTMQANVTHEIETGASRYKECFHLPRLRCTINVRSHNPDLDMLLLPLFDDGRTSTTKAYSSTRAAS